MELEKRETLLVILGAGASFDSLPAFPPRGRLDNTMARTAGLEDLPLYAVRPPLTQQLADLGPLLNSVLGRWRWARPAVDHLRRSLVSKPNEADEAKAMTLEQSLRAYADGEGVVPERRRHVLALRFYLRDLLWACTSYVLSSDLTGGITNQLALLGRVLEWCGSGERCAVFVSFNYDLIIERAMESAWNFNPVDVESYLAHDRVHLLKPHGSVQWQWTLKQNPKSIYFSDPLLHAAESIERALLDEPQTDSLVMLSRAPHELEAGVLRDRPALLPALALPVDGKTDFVWPRRQSERFDSLRGSVARLLTIGWRGFEPHFLARLRPLVAERARILVVQGGSEGDVEAAHTRERLAAYIEVGPNAWRTLGGGFGALLKEAETLAWLLNS